MTGYMGGRNPPGWHFHFINEDCTRDAAFQDMELARDVNEAIHKAETATTGKN